MSSETKKSFYVWFLGARECPGLRGDNYVQPIVRYLKQKEEEREPAKVTLQISAKGIKLIAESLKHFVPSHAVTFVSQGSSPDDDIVSAILLLYNPITKCPIHVHSYRCDSSETADVLRQSLQTLVDMPENMRKIRDLEDRLQSQGLYLSPHTDSKLLKSCDTGFGGSSGDLLSAPESDEEEREPMRHAPRAVRRVKEDDEDRITRLFDSLAAELRDKLSSNAAPLLLPPRDYEAQPREKSAVSGRRIKKHEDSSGPSSGIGSDLEDPTAATTRSGFKTRSQRVSSCDKLDYRKRSSYHEAGSSMTDKKNLGRSANDLTRIRESSSGRYFYRDPEEKRDELPGRGKVKEVLSLFESRQEKLERSGNHRSKSFCNETPQSWAQTSRKKSSRVAYHELREKERYPGLDRETARLDYHPSFSRPRRSESHAKSGDFFSEYVDRNDSVAVFVETLGNGHFRAVREPLASDMKNHGLPRR